MRIRDTVMCLSIGTPTNNKFSIVPNGKFIFFRCSEIWANYILTIISLNIGTLKIINFPFGKLMVLSVPILNHLRVIFVVSGLKHIL